ncbi:unnamed protein product, partial [marine sediment metagenome]
MVAIGGIMLPQMVDHGYGRGLSVGIVIAAALLGPIIPPSGIAIIMGSLMELSVATLFASGMLPGLLLSAGYLIVGITICVKRKIPVKEKAEWRTRLITTVKATPMFTLPIIVLGGIYGGFVTPTEAGTLCCIVGFF